MRRIILYLAILEIAYLAISFTIGQVYGQWSYEGEIIRTGFRLVPIVIYSYVYQKLFYDETHNFQTKPLVVPHFIAALLLLVGFALSYTNAENETLLWQVIFVISGITAGLREELFYRGIIQNILQTKYDGRIALVFTTLIFMLSHVQYIASGQLRGLLLISFAGVIFSCIFIYTGSVVFTAFVHGLYDALLSIQVVPLRLNGDIAIFVLFLIMMTFLTMISKKQSRPLFTVRPNRSNHDTLSMQ